MDGHDTDDLGDTLRTTGWSREGGNYGAYDQEIFEDGPGPRRCLDDTAALEFFADKVLRLAARLKEAEELLADPDLQWGGGSWIDFGTCPLCGGRRPGGGKPAGHVPDCRLHAFLASGKEGA